MTPLIVYNDLSVFILYNGFSTIISIDKMLRQNKTRYKKIVNPIFYSLKYIKNINNKNAYKVINLKVLPKRHK